MIFDQKQNQKVIMYQSQAYVGDLVGSFPVFPGFLFSIVDLFRP